MGMGMRGRAEWSATTHEWSRDVDVEHLHSIRASRRAYEAGGVRHQILEVLAYVDDEAAALGRTGHAVVRFTADGMVAIADDGRGTDTRRDEDGDVVRKPVMATRDIRFFDAPSPPLLPDGLPRRGISTVAALTSLLVHENHRREGGWTQEYRHGIPSSALDRLPGRSTSGTIVAFRSELGAPAELTAADLTGFRWLTVRVG